MRKELFHYCSNQKCFSILESKTIRLSDIQKSNDYKELSLFFPKIFDYLEELYNQKPFRFKYAEKTGTAAFEEMLDLSYEAWRKKFATGEFSNFVLCFSENPDSLSQWRGYADNGKGCCIGFSHEELEHYCLLTNNVLRLEKVVYLADEGIDNAIFHAAKDILEDLRGLRKWIIENMTHDDNDPDTDGLLHYNFDGMLESSFIDSLQYKSFAFNEENEWRLFFSRPAYKKPEWIANNEETEFKGPDGFAETIRFLNNRVDFLKTDSDLVPYCPVGFEEFDCVPVSSVWVGPKNNIRSSDLELFLKTKGYTSTRIEKSRITYC